MTPFSSGVLAIVCCLSGEILGFITDELSPKAFAKGVLVGQERRLED